MLIYIFYLNARDQITMQLSYYDYGNISLRFICMVNNASGACIELHLNSQTVVIVIYDKILIKWKDMFRGKIERIKTSVYLAFMNYIIAGLEEVIALLLKCIE